MSLLSGASKFVLYFECLLEIKICHQEEITTVVGFPSEMTKKKRKKKKDAPIKLGKRKILP